MVLDGPYNDSNQLMNDGLRAAGLVPETEPFTSLGMLQVGEGGGEVTTPAVLLGTGNNAIVDWVLIEARDGSLSTTVLNTRAALLQRDGDVVDMDGISSITMQLSTGNYHIAVRHRNHFGVMTALPVALSAVTPVIDLTSSATAVYGTDARKSVCRQRMVLWAGNCLRDQFMKYTGASNDRDPILVRIGGSVPTATTTGYFAEDATMDGVVKYTGVSNDRDIILLNIGGVVGDGYQLEQLP